MLKSGKPNNKKTKLNIFFCLIKKIVKKLHSVYIIERIRFVLLVVINKLVIIMNEYNI